MPGNKLLLIEDDPEIAELLRFSLSREGYEVRLAGDAEQALRALAERLPEVIVLDWMLPGTSGLDLARRLRRDEATRTIPIIMLTAKGEEQDKLRSFDAGVDDYLTKPFSPRELEARIKALLRRSGTQPGQTLEVGALVLDTLGHQLRINGQATDIGPTEFRLLEFLMRHPDRVFDRGQLLDHVWGHAAGVEERTVDVHVLRLRKILAPAELAGMLQTVRGVGYRFAALA